MNNDQEEFIWQPRRGIDEAAARQLLEQCPRPSHAMGEAWFMGKTRRLYDELLTTPFERIREKYLNEIIAGTCCFGHRKEWEDWFLFLLGNALQPDYVRADNWRQK